MVSQAFSPTCSVHPFLPLPFIFIYFLLTIPRNLSWMLITAAVPIMLPLCHVSSLSLLRMRTGGVASLSPREEGGTQWMSRRSRKILSHLRKQQREKGYRRPTGAPRAPAGMTGMPSLSFASNISTSEEEQLCQCATVSGAPLQPDLSLADLLPQEKVGHAGLNCLRIRSSDQDMCLPCLHLAPVLNSDC